MNYRGELRSGLRFSSLSGGWELDTFGVLRRESRGEIFWPEKLLQIYYTPLSFDARTERGRRGDRVECAKVAQLVEHTPEKRGVVGSIPTLGIFYLNGMIFRRHNVP